MLQTWLPELAMGCLHAFACMDTGYIETGTGTLAFEPMFIVYCEV